MESKAYKATYHAGAMHFERQKAIMSRITAEIP